MAFCSQDKPIEIFKSLIFHATTFGGSVLRSFLNTYINKCYLPAGRSRIGRNWARGLEYGGRGPYSGPKAKFWPIRTDQGRQRTSLFFSSTVLLSKQLYCWILIKAVQFKSGAGTHALDILGTKAILFCRIYLTLWVCVEWFVLRCNMQKAWKVGKVGEVRTQGPDEKIRTAGVLAISQSDSRI